MIKINQNSNKIITILIISTFGFYCSRNSNTHSLRPEIDSLVCIIEKENILTSNSVGYSGNEPEQWRRYLRLKEKTTDEELISLTNHKNSVLRSYSFQALVSRKKTGVFPILLNHLNDTALVKTFFDCIQQTEFTGDYFLDIVSPGFFDSTLFKLNKRQKLIIDSVLIFCPDIRLEAKSNLLKNLQPNEKFYKRIKRIATKEKNFAAFIALARYQKKSDIKLIEDAFKRSDGNYDIIYAIKEFPDQSFLPLLIDLFDKKWNEFYYDYNQWQILYQALAKYPCHETYLLFERTLMTKDNFRYQTLGTYLLIAISKYPNPIFEPLRDKIKLDKYQLEKFNFVMSIKPIT